MTGAAFRVFAIGAMLGAAVFLLAPLAIIAAASFSPTPVFDLPVGGASLRWYAAVGSLDGFWPALTLSLEIALLSTAVSLVLGTLAGIAIARGAMPGASTGALAAGLLGKLTSPSQAAIRAERKIRLQEALNRMDPLDREILVLRHYEQMTNGDAAAALGLDFKAASKRYTRALERLERILAALPGDTSGSGP